MTVRLKLTLWLLGVILLVNSAFSLVFLLDVQRKWSHEVQERVRLDLKAAQAEYDGRGEQLTRFLQGLAVSGPLADALQSNDRDALTKFLARPSRAGRMDFLVACDSEGRLLAGDAEGRPTRLAITPLVVQARHEDRGATGTLLLSAAELALLGPNVARRARLEVWPTPRARPTRDRVRTEGLVQAAAVAVRDARGQLAGFLLGGNLLNRRQELVDALKQQVLTEETWRGQPIATVTIFQNDLRVATNVIQQNGRRATGTRMSQEVADQVLRRGRTWIGPAFAVNDWYISAYAPLRDPEQRIVGSLYVGLLEAPFRAARNATVTRFLLALGLTTLTSILLLVAVALLVLRPIGRIVWMSRRVVSGDLTARVGQCPAGELGILCRAVDAMADAVAEREKRLEVATRQHIGRSEKLASIGRLAAGIAHEINNPLTGVLTFAHLLRERPNMEEQDRQDLDMIIQETTRTSEIVRGLLDFARERPVLKERVDLNDVVQRTVRLLRNQKQFRRIETVLELGDGLPDVDADMNQLQQVLINLALNASAAMPEGGTLTIRTAPGEAQIRLEVSDTGYGIKPEHLDKIFDPFFTTKPVGDGTGLGLSVSYGIIEQHGGEIEVESQLGQGTTFTILLPAAETKTASPFSEEVADWGL